MYHQKKQKLRIFTEPGSKKLIKWFFFIPERTSRVIHYSDNVVWNDLCRELTQRSTGRLSYSQSKWTSCWIYTKTVIEQIQNIRRCINAILLNENAILQCSGLSMLADVLNHTIKEDYFFKPFQNENLQFVNNAGFLTIVLRTEILFSPNIFFVLLADKICSDLIAEEFKIEKLQKKLYQIIWTWALFQYKPL